MHFTLFTLRNHSRMRDFKSLQCLTSFDGIPELLRSTITFPNPIDVLEINGKLTMRCSQKHLMVRMGEFTLKLVYFQTVLGFCRSKAFISDVELQIKRSECDPEDILDQQPVLT